VAALDLLRRLLPLPGNRTATGRETDPRVRRYLDETRRRHDWLRAPPTAFATGRELLAADPAAQAAFVPAALAAVVARGQEWRGGGSDDLYRLRGLLSELTRRPLPYTAADVHALVDRLVACRWTWRSGFMPLRGLLRSVGHYVAAHGLSPELRAALERLRAEGERQARNASDRAALALLQELLGVLPAEPTLDPGDDWGRHASADLERMDLPERAAWLTLLAHARTASGARPSKPWRDRARRGVAALAGVPAPAPAAPGPASAATAAERTAAGEQRFKANVVAWLDLFRQPTRDELYKDDASGAIKPTAVLAEKNATVLKGIVWCCALFDDAELAGALGRAAEACYRKVPDVGPRSAMVGNACVWALGAMPGRHGVGQLQRVQQRATYARAQRLIEDAVAEAAERAGVSPEELEERSVPTCGLEAGPIRRQLGGHTAEVVVAGVHDVALRWTGPDGRPRATPPAAVKAAHADELRALKRTVEELRRMLPAQRDRVERLFLAERVWRLGEWREHYLDHPLVGFLARRLIWSFEGSDRAASGAWLDGAIVGADDRPIDWLEDGTPVRLWHPISDAPAAVLAWREWLERHAVTQPFKQAHREVYLLTDAERSTGTYSNRFAAHILRQHQLKALCDQRGWRMRLQGGFDAGSDCAPRRELPGYGLRAEFWSSAVEGHESVPGIGLYVATDQVRFTPMREWGPLRLEEVPARVFSEVMRDVDLFVGVCSVGNDPAWRDDGPREQRSYWEAYAFGDLSQSARTRREVLARLLPRLGKLAGRWELADRFLVVRGQLRSYRIHLGSGNILMSPNDQYLCIVPGRGRGDVLFLPFEGDTLLPVIVSKALMLAEDDRITDPTIARQISARA
jgi:hypothetical protein